MALFTVAEARTFNRGELSNPTVFPDSEITAREIAIRARFERIIGVALEPTASTEYHDGDGTPVLWLRHHNPYAEAVPRSVSVSAVTWIDQSGDETDFTAGELEDLICYPDRIVLRYAVWPSGYRTVRVTYTHGYVTVPDDIKRAALLVCVRELARDVLVPSEAFEGTDGSIRWSRVRDPARGRWYGDEVIDSTLNEHRAIETGVRIA